jgi:predicted acylesterase/phospholipase RssA
MTDKSTNKNINNFDINEYINNKLNKLLDKDKPTKYIDTLVLSGGSVKGIAQIGALHYMESHGILKNINTIAGSSVGAIVGTMFALGYRPIEIYNFFLHVDIDKFSNINAYNFFNKLGLDDGKRFTLICRKFFKAKFLSADITFAEFYKINKIKLIITGVCVNDKKVYYFSHETEPNMKIINALRISISIPILFTPRKYKDKVFIDGGCIDNYPISLFDHKIDNVIGIYAKEKRESEKITSIEIYLKNTIQCLQEGVIFNTNPKYDSRTIFIKCEGGTSKKHIMAMFDQGYCSAVKFFKK